MSTTYSDSQKAEALDVLETEGIWAAVTLTGAHHTTIYRWHAQAVRSGTKKAEDEAVEAEIQDITRQRLRRRLLETAMAHVDRSDAARSAQDAQRYATSAGILLDKFRLEMGEHTDRQQVVSPMDMELERVLHEWKRQTDASA